MECYDDHPGYSMELGGGCVVVKKGSEKTSQEAAVNPKRHSDAVEVGRSG